MDRSGSCVEWSFIGSDLRLKLGLFLQPNPIRKEDGGGAEAAARAKLGDGEMEMVSVMASQSHRAE